MDHCFLNKQFYYYNYYDLLIFDIICTFSKLANTVILSLDNDQPMIVDYKITNIEKTNQPNNIIEEKDNEINDEHKEFMLKFYLVSKANNDEYSDDDSVDNNDDNDDDNFDN